MNIEQASKKTLALAEKVNVIPVLAIEELSHAVPIAQALVDGGLAILEVTLRTKNALKAMEAMAKVDGAIIASGTVLNKQQLKDASNAGAQFHVSPGATDKLIEASQELNAPLLPGAVTSSEIMRLMEYGYQFLKFFPAEASGGVKSLKSLAGPFSTMKFCPTGGISESTLGDYLALSNVVCAGGSWLVNDEIIAHKNWKLISEMAKKVS